MPKDKSSGFGGTLEPAKSNHSGQNAKVVALCRWLLFAGSVMRAMSQCYVYCIPMCYKPNSCDIKGFFYMNYQVRKSRRANLTNFFISIYRLSKSINRVSYLDLSTY